MDEQIASNFESNTRIDLPHEPLRAEPAREESVRDESTPRIARRRRSRNESEPAVATAAQLHRSAAVSNALTYVPEPPESLPDIVVRHADDLSQHLAGRLHEVEQRELALEQFQSRLAEAEAAAQAWVVQRDLELTSRERQVQFREDEVSTRAAAIAAAEIASEAECRTNNAALDQRVEDLDRRIAELDQREERLLAERLALTQAGEKLAAQRRREEELQRSRRQQWQTLQEGDRAQAERLMANLVKHRHSLDQREKALTPREAALRSATAAPSVPSVSVPLKAANLDTAALRAQATRDHRAALEHRYIAGQLWSKLVGSGLASDDELHDALDQVRRELESLYRREREALEDLKTSLTSMARRLQPAPARATPRRASQQARVLA